MKPEAYLDIILIVFILAFWVWLFIDAMRWKRVARQMQKQIEEQLVAKIERDRQQQ